MESLFAMGGSALFGFIFKLIANHQENKAKQQELLIAGVKASDESMDKAAKRAGIWMQRFVVLVMISLFAYLVSGAGEPTNIVETIKGQSFLWGLWETKPETVITAVNGAILDDTTRTAVLSIISFLFGVDSASKR